MSPNDPVDDPSTNSTGGGSRLLNASIFFAGLSDWRSWNGADVETEFSLGGSDGVEYDGLDATEGDAYTVIGGDEVAIKVAMTKDHRCALVRVDERPLRRGVIEVVGKKR